MNGENCTLSGRCANKGTFLCVDDALNGSIGCFRYKTGNGEKYRRDNFEKAEKRWRERVCISLRDNVCRPDSGEHRK